MKGKAKKRERLTPEQLDANYNKFMKGKELNPNGKELFEKVLKKAATVKQRSAK
jgi:hypothetical protein